MAKITIYNLEGKKVEDLELNDSVFALPISDDILHQVYVAQASNQRQVLAHTKNRGERAGSGIKPWRQKGTGRARVGSVRSPIWRKGGVTFGPTKDRNFKKKINRKVNTQAIKLALSGKLRDQEIFVIDKMEIPERKTKTAVLAMKNMKIKGNTLVVFSQAEKANAVATQNIPKVTNIPVSQLNVLDILNNKNLLLSKDSIKYLEEKYGK